MPGSSPGPRTQANRLGGSLNLHPVTPLRQADVIVTDDIPMGNSGNLEDFSFDLEHVALPRGKSLGLLLYILCPFSYVSWYLSIDYIIVLKYHLCNT